MDSRKVQFVCQAIDTDAKFKNVSMLFSYGSSILRKLSRETSDRHYEKEKEKVTRYELYTFRYITYVFFYPADQNEIIMPTHAVAELLVY